MRPHVNKVGQILISRSVSVVCVQMFISFPPHPPLHCCCCCCCCGSWPAIILLPSLARSAAEAEITARKQQQQQLPPRQTAAAAAGLYLSSCLPCFLRPWRGSFVLAAS